MMTSTIKDKLNNFISKIEQNQITGIQLICWLIFIGISKFLLEDVIFFRKVNPSDYLNEGIYMILFYVLVYLATMIIIKLFSKVEMKKVINASVFFYPILLLGPIIDYYIHEVPEVYNMVAWGTTLIDCLKRYPGITITGLYMMFLAGCYVTLKRNLIWGIISTIIIFLVYYYIFASQLFLDLRSILLSHSILDTLPIYFQQYPHLYTYNLLFLFAGLILSIMFLYLYDPLLFKKFINRIRLARAFQYILILTFGFSVVGDFGLIRVFIHFMNMLGILCLWIGSVIINDYYDLESDQINNVKRNVDFAMNKSETFTLSSILWLFALLIALQISAIVFQMYLAVIIISYLYSAPPARFKRYVLSSIFIGIITFVVVLIGIFSNINATIYNDRILYIAVLLGITMAAGVNVIDLKDYEGDLKTGVKSLPTVFGLQKAKIIIAVLTGISYLALGYFLTGLMRTPWYYTAILPAIVMPWLVLKYQDSKRWWTVYLGFHIITLINGILINIFLAYFHLIFTF